MARSGQKVVIVGAGPAGLSVAVGMAQLGHSVTVLERRSAAFWKQCGAKAVPGRLYESTGCYPQRHDVAQEMLLESADFRRRMPEAVVDVQARYFVPDASQEAISSDWQEFGIQPSDDPNDRSPISTAFRRKHALRTFHLQDKVIDPARLVQSLENQLRQAGGRTIFGAETIGCRREENYIATVYARTPIGLQRFPTDVFINAADSRMRQVIERIGSNANISSVLKTVATAVLRFPWPFSIEPTILQFFGPPDAHVLKNLRIMPEACTRNASVSTSDWIPIDDPDEINQDLLTERRKLLHLLAEGFDLLELPEPQDISWRVQALQLCPAHSAKKGIAKTGNLPVLRGRLFGGSENEFLCMPGKLRSVLTLRNAACIAVEEFEVEDQLVAA